MQPSIELSFIESLVLKIDTLALFVFLQDYMGFVGAGINVAINWGLFRYHFVKMLSYEFFTENYDVAAYFARNRFSSWRSFAMFIFPVGVGVILYSIVTGFNTVKFIRLFGTSKSLTVFTKPNKFKVKIRP